MLVPSAMCVWGREVGEPEGLLAEILSSGLWALGALALDWDLQIRPFYLWI
jgi:hypothetical protein